MTIRTASSGGTVFTTPADNTTFDYFTDTFQVNDAVYFGRGDWYGPLIQNLRIQVGTAISATSYSGVWEIYNYVGSTYAWRTINVTDNTNGFSTVGQNTVTWTQDDITNWTETTVNSQRKHWIRYRITAVNTPTEGGANATTEAVGGNNTYTISGGQYSVSDFEALGTAEKAIVRPNPESNKGFQIRAMVCISRAGSTDSWWLENVEDRVIQFVCPAKGRHKYSYYTSGTGHSAILQFGKIDSDNKVIYGIDYDERSQGSSYGTYIYQPTIYSYMYGTKFKSSITETASGNDIRLDILRGSIINTPQRVSILGFAKNTNFLNCQRLEGCIQDSIIENTTPLTSTLFYNQHWVRCNIHNVGINKYYGAGHTYLYDNTFSGTITHTITLAGREVIEAYNCYIKVVDENGLPISGATVTCTDQYGGKLGWNSLADVGTAACDDGGFTVTTNPDGWAGLLWDTATGGGTYYIECTNKFTWATSIYRNFMGGLSCIITSGTGAGQYGTVKSIASSSPHTLTRLLMSDYWTTPDTTSKFIINPFVMRKRTTATGVTKDYGPFNLTVTAPGYRTVNVYVGENIEAEVGKRNSPMIVSMSKGDTVLYDSTLYDSIIY